MSAASTTAWKHWERSRQKHEGNHSSNSSSSGSDRSGGGGSSNGGGGSSSSSSSSSSGSSGDISIGPRWLMPRMYCSHIGLLYYP